MNKLTAAALGTALAFGAIFPSIAQTNTGATSEQPVTGKVASVAKSEVTVQFPENQTETYRVDPALLTAMNLTEGATVNFNNRKLGTIVNVSRYSVAVEFANGDVESYLLTEEGRRTFTFGDRVVITPDLQLARADNYVLTAADVQVPMSAMMTRASSSSGTMSQPMPNGMSPTVPPSSSMSVPSTTPAPSEPAATPTEPERTPPSNPSDPVATPSSPDTSVPNTPKTPRGPNTPGSVLKP